MTLSRPIKLALGIVTIWPLIYASLFMLMILATMIMEGAVPIQGPGIRAGFVVVLMLHIATICLIFGLMTFYFIYLFKTSRVAEDKKALWAIVLFLGHMVAMPIFFWLYVWPERVAEPRSNERTSAFGSLSTS